MTKDDLKMGLRVRALYEFAGVPAGTIGAVVERGNSWPENESVAVEWSRHPGDRLTDWFSYDELKYLEVVHH